MIEKIRMLLQIACNHIGIGLLSHGCRWFECGGWCWQGQRAIGIAQAVADSDFTCTDRTVEKLKKRHPKVP
jgi:hypothetical protein